MKDWGIDRQRGKRTDQIKEEIKKYYEKDYLETDVSALGKGFAIGPERTVRALILELVDPVILFDDDRHEIKIWDKVYAASFMQVEKTLKEKYIGAVPNFPDIVDRFIRGDSRKLQRLGNVFESSDFNDMMRELRDFKSICPLSKDGVRGVTLLSGYSPIEALTEYEMDGMHMSGKALRTLNSPVTLSSAKARFKFICDKGVKISDGRLEKNMVIDLINAEFVIGGSQGRLNLWNSDFSKDALDLVSALLIIFGVGITAISRFRLVEIGAPAAVLGALIYLYTRFKDVRIPSRGSNLPVIEDTPLQFGFFGELDEYI